MSSGHEDYWYKYLTSHNVMGQDLVDWFQSGTIELDAGTWDYIIDYTVPDGYRLNVTGGMVSANRPGICPVYAYIDDVMIWRIFYDVNLLFPFNPASGHVLTQGQTFKVVVYNTELILPVYFYCALFGFEEIIY